MTPSFLPDGKSGSAPIRSTAVIPGAPVLNEGGAAASPSTAAPALPIEQVQPVLEEPGFWAQLKGLLLYLSGTEVHTYAFSVAANVILALFPFIVMMLTVAQQVFHSQAMVEVLTELMDSLLPSNQQFVMHNMKLLSHPHQGTQIFSVFMLLVTTTGVFLPLEVALNNVWGVRKHRNYFANQLVSLGLAAAAGGLVMVSVALSAGQKTLLGWIFFGHTDNFVYHAISRSIMEILATIASILLFFVIYWILPNRKVPALAVLPTAIVVGLAWEFAKHLYVLALPRLDFESVYGPFKVSVGIMMWAFLSGLMLLAGAHFSATRHALRTAREESRKASPGSTS